MKNRLPKIQCSESELISTYNETIKDVLFYKAHELEIAYKLLETHCMFFNLVKNKDNFSTNMPNLSSIILMLRGMSLECLLKMILIRRGEIKVTDGELKLVEKYSKHNLKNMAEDIPSLDLNEEEFAVLSILSSHIELGRLPPKKALSQPQILTWELNNHERLFDVILKKIYLLK